MGGVARLPEVRKSNFMVLKAYALLLHGYIFVWRDINAYGNSDIVNSLVIEQFLVKQEMPLLSLLRVSRTRRCEGFSPAVTLPAHTMRVGQIRTILFDHCK